MTSTTTTSSTTDTFKGNYELLEELGKGAHSTVYSAKNLRTGDRVAVKVIEKSKLSVKDLESIKREISILKSLDHPNLLIFYEFCQDPTRFYIVTELLEGGELFARIVEREFYSEMDAQAVLRSLASALHYIHTRKIVHRDLKPENILLASREDDAAIKLADFGFAKQQMDDVNPSLTTALGTANYIAPEILMRKPYDDKVDLWAFGVIMYVLLCGYPPFHDENQARMFEKIKAGKFQFDEPYWSNVSEMAKDLIRKLLVVDPTKRLSIEEVLAHEWIKGELPQAKDITPALSELRANLARRKIKTGIRSVMAMNKIKSLVAKQSAGGGEDS